MLAPTMMISSRTPSFRSNVQLLRWSDMLLLLLAFTSSARHFVQGQECAADGTTCDKHERCPYWKEEGECIRNRIYMREHCPVSCSSLTEDSRTLQQDDGSCDDLHERCYKWADLGECTANPKDMNVYCRKSCGLCGEDATDQSGDGTTGTNDVKHPEEESKPQVLCKDQHKSCRFWAKKGECDSNSRYMHEYCAQSCNTCAKLQQIAKGRKLTGPEAGRDSNVDESILQSTTQFGELQRAEGDYRDATLQVIVKTIEYMESDDVKTLPKHIRMNCQNRNSLCAFWVALGECEKNIGYMKTNCAPSCQSCHLIDINQRCPKLDDAKPALRPGDLNKMFERIVAAAPGNRTLTDEERSELEASGIPEYFVAVHSRPSESPATEISAVQDKSLPPWVITFDNLMTPEECEAMIQLGYKYGYKRSEDVGEEKFDGSHDSVKSERRTSENSWCSDREGCRSEEVPQRIHERLSKIMNIPPENSEDFQMLKYEKGQFYRTHHDFIPHQVDRQCGPRILTFFLYLNDVEHGGGTNFPQLDITVNPKQGRALLWPSVLDSDPMKMDKRMYHQALDVEAGIKFAANGWIHMYDYMTPQNTGCT